MQELPYYPANGVSDMFWNQVGVSGVGGGFGVLGLCWLLEGMHTGTVRAVRVGEDTQQ